jgi:Zn-dependent M28 family amino/carboxypeptidase
MLDDHVPFLKAGMPVVDLIDFEYGSAPEKNDYWHTPEDTMDKLSPESLQIVGRVVLRMINKLM